MTGVTFILSGFCLLKDWTTLELDVIQPLLNESMVLSILCSHFFLSLVLLVLGILCSDLFLSLVLLVLRML